VARAKSTFRRRGSSDGMPVMLRLTDFSADQLRKPHDHIHPASRSRQKLVCLHRVVIAMISSSLSGCDFLVDDLGNVSGTYQARQNCEPPSPRWRSARKVALALKPASGEEWRECSCSSSGSDGADMQRGHG
jgi:hypothetical protein